MPTYARDLYILVFPPLSTSISLHVLSNTPILPKRLMLFQLITKFFGCFVCLFVFVALRPMSTAMVIAGRSVHLTTLFSWASLNKQLTSNHAHTFACNWQQ